MCGDRLRIHILKVLDRLVSGVRFLTRGGVTLHIVDLWQYYVRCTRSGITLRTISMLLTWAVYANAGYRWCFCRTVVYLCGSSLQYTQDFYSPVSISV